MEMPSLDVATKLDLAGTGHSLYATGLAPVASRSLTNVIYAVDRIEVRRGRRANTAALPISACDHRCRHRSRCQDNCRQDTAGVSDSGHRISVDHVWAGPVVCSPVAPAVGIRIRIRIADRRRMGDEFFSSLRPGRDRSGMGDGQAIG